MSNVWFQNIFELQYMYTECCIQSQIQPWAPTRQFQVQNQLLYSDDWVTAITPNSYKKTVSLCKIPLPYIALMHTLPLFYPTPRMPSPYCIPAHACPPPISIPLHASNSPIFTLAHDTPSPILSQPMHAPPPILSQPMHAIPTILAHLMHTLSLFFPSPHTPPQYSILFQPMHALLTPCHIHLEGMFLLWHLHMPLLILLTPVYHHHLPCLAIGASLHDMWMLFSLTLLFSFTWTHHINLHIYQIITTYIVYHYSSVDITHSST